MKGVERWWDRRARVEQAGRDGALSHQEIWPRPQVGAFSYRLVMPCHRHCSPLVRESISFRLLYSASCKSPQRDSRHVLALRIPSVSHWEKLFSRQLPRKKWLGVGGWGGERKELKNENVWCHCPPSPCPSSPSRTHTIPFALVTTRLFPVPTLFAGPSLTVPENPTFS